MDERLKRRLVGINELSEYLGIKKQTLYDWVWLKKIPYIKCGKLIRFDLKRIDEWLEKMSVEVKQYNVLMGREGIKIEKQLK